VRGAGGTQNTPYGRFGSPANSGALGCFDPFLSKMQNARLKTTPQTRKLAVSVFERSQWNRKSNSDSLIGNKSVA
jgi:hypothetical protein